MTKIDRSRGGSAARACAFAITFAILPARADPVADFYKDKTITVVSAGEAGGAHGVYAQLIAAYMRKYIPGNPALNVQFMVGAGGNLSMNYLYNVAPKDGTYIGVPLQDLIFNARIGVAAVKYDPSKARYLGGADTTRTTVTVMKSSGIATIEDAHRNEVVIGASGGSGQNYIVPIVLNALLGTRFRVVAGYPGINVIHLAMDRGEVQGTAASWAVVASTRKDWVDKKLINNLVTIGMTREPDLPDVPALAELVSDPRDLALVPLLAGSAALGRAWVGFGDIPPDRLSVLRSAYVSVMNDPAFRAEALQKGLPIDPVDWTRQQDLARTIQSTPDEAVARLKAIIGAS